jgi:hypothetical protein
MGQGHGRRKGHRSRLGLGSATGAARVLSGASRILVVQGRSNGIERYAPTGVEMGQMSDGPNPEWLCLFTA